MPRRPAITPASKEKKRGILPSKVASDRRTIVGFTISQWFAFQGQTANRVNGNARYVPRGQRQHCFGHAPDLSFPTREAAVRVSTGSAPLRHIQYAHLARCRDFRGFISGKCPGMALAHGCWR